MLYLKIDVLLLSDCLLNFRKTIYENYEIEPLYSYTLAGMAWRCMLKFTDVKLDTIQDVDMILFFENQKRGGVSSVLSDRHVIANNKYFKDYDKNLPSNYLFYLDLNNLYGWSMVQNLPTGNLKWEEENYYYTDKPCTVEVDLEYTQEAKNKTWKYPLLPFNRVVNRNELSDYQNDTLKSLNIKNSKEPKLILYLFDKKKYIVYYKTLKFYESMGIKIKKIHRTISFDESNWLKPYIDNNTKNRSQAKCDFEKNIWKLMNNAPYGKFLENIRDRISINFPTENNCKYYATQLNFEGMSNINNEIVIFKMKEKEVYYNKPIYVGSSILDLSKLKMYDFYYNLINKTWPLNEICYTDTDSVILNINTEDLYEDLHNCRYDFDLCDYPKDHKSFHEQNKKVIGYPKDETNGEPIKELIAVLSKVYGYDHHLKIKGTSKSTIEKQITMDDLRHCIYHDEQLQKINYSIRSKKFDLFTLEQNKIACSPIDQKRYMINNIKTLPFCDEKTKKEILNQKEIESSMVNILDKVV